jgi:hypothetical protein
MKRPAWMNVLDVAVVSGALLVSGCGESDEDTDNQGADAGGPGAADAGCPGAADAGCPGASDAGCPGASDAGCPGASDAGCPGASDAGCPGASDAGCPGAADAGCPGAAAIPADPAEWSAWLSAEHYKKWRCDETAQAPLPDSPHGSNVICVNDVLDDARSGSGAYPVGAAAVKVTFNGDGSVNNRYLDVRTSDAAGAAGWYFLVAGGPSGAGDSAATTFCASCHAAGGRDYVRRVPE